MAQQSEREGSATDLFYKPGEKPSNSSKFVILGLESEKPVVDKSTVDKPASDYRHYCETHPVPTPGARDANGAWHFRSSAGDLAGAFKEWVWNDVAPSPERMARSFINIAWKTTIVSGEALNSVREFPPIKNQEFRDYLRGTIENPEIYRWNSPAKDLDLRAADRAYDAFNLESLNLPRSLIPGIILNEIKHYKPLLDDKQGFAAEHGFKLGPQDSIGPAQMQVKNIEELVHARDGKTGDYLYPQLQQFKAEPLKAALDPAKAPYFVAAYLLNEVAKIDRYNKIHRAVVVPINADTLAYRYNYDVFIDDHGVKRSLEPSEKLLRKITGTSNFEQCPWPMRGIVEKSNHVRNVKAAMKQVEPYLPK
ncbi:MAG: hypothetical protein Q8T09_15020 [Candidatus Melainabacteria bacterium]|nr:hypothetical protein [Candidatus Melainabacteria bacterium]